jgi:hypothetical protein
MAYDSADERWCGYHVTPRYLALRALLDRGWTLTSDELSTIYVTTPDQRVRLGCLPEGDELCDLQYSGGPAHPGASISVTGPTVIRMEQYHYQSSPGRSFVVSETRGGAGNVLGDTVLR